MADSNQIFICDEHLMVNKFYQPSNLMNEENTYKYKLAMNHHNILEQKDFEYYNRCVERFIHLLENDSPKIYLHIRHLITNEKYEEEKDDILKEFIDFDEFMAKNCQSSLKGLFFILVKDKKESNEFRGELLYDSNITGSKIFIIYVNNQFIDAGETFIEDDKEVTFITETIKNHI